MSKYSFDPQPYKKQIYSIIKDIENIPDEESSKWNNHTLDKIIKLYPKDGKGLFSRDQILAGYKLLAENKELEYRQDIHNKIRLKPTRTISGVAPVTVLTKPFPCPGKCIFCPNDVRMPKSYLADEPGAQRAEMNHFDPYLQTYNRLLAFQNTGHNVEKVELIVLGGTWSFYPESYQIWFIKRCFDAMNDFGVKDERAKVHTKNIFKDTDNHTSVRVQNLEPLHQQRRKTYNEIIAQVAQKNVSEFFSKSEFATWKNLEEQQLINEKAKSKCVGLVIETRPDYIDEKEVIKIRRLGATKVQIGIQSLNDQIMEMNKRGHGRKETENGIRLLRLAGFKIHGHWMPNLYGSTVDEDIKDYIRLWESTISPDELKIYPTSIIENTELNERYKQGLYKPYSYDELLKVLTNTIPKTPRYCRLTRIIRDIPSTDIVDGNKLTNFRQIAENQIEKEGKRCECIRCREIKNLQLNFDDLETEEIEYETPIGRQIFMSYKTKVDDKIACFLRLSLPNELYKNNNFIPELNNKAMIREVHVYGQVVGIGKEEKGKSQHIGLGTKMIERAKVIAKENGFTQISVISAIGTRDYYRKKGFEVDGMYMTSEC